MKEMIQARKGKKKKDERYDLFSSLLDANEDEQDDAASKLSDSELMGEQETHLQRITLMNYVYAGNIFVFLIAGASSSVFWMGVFTFPA